MGIYTEDRRYALCHVPKCAGWSVKAFIAEHTDDLVVPDSPSYADWDATKNPKLPKGHLRLADWERFTGIDPSEYETVLAVRRNPYELALSQYTYWRELWEKGGRMVQHRLAAQYPTFTEWLKDPRSEYHVRYEYHEHRPPKYMGDAAPGYADHGGYFAYWLAVDGTVPDNVTVLEMDGLADDLPKLLGVDAEVPHENQRDSKPDLHEHYTDEARQLVEERFAYAFTHWYETGLPEPDVIALNPS